ncbi:ZSCAN2 [Branchiostoma lanceolatum]|uniref:ZSCAN2 protein n=1 Tax=Branchiostoma lanceolatum TaxID=7740 RepID=A0A8J9Z9V2_BRALA|nr:ZSCAN2 [Branchiostoma lanceolatum]
MAEIQGRFPPQRSKGNWSSRETICLIHLWNNDLILTKLKKARKKEAYELLTRGLHEAGYVRTTKQVNVKVRDLKYQYRRHKDAIREKREVRSDWEFFEVLDTFLGDQHATGTHLRETMAEECGDADVRGYEGADFVSDTTTSPLGPSPSPARCYNDDSTAAVIGQMTYPLYPTPHDFGRNWMTDETRTLISLWAEPSVQKELEIVFHNQTVYERLGRQMCQAGWQRTWKQCQVKIKDLKWRYRRARKMIENGENGSSVCPFYDQLYTILGDKLDNTPQFDSPDSPSVPDSVHPVLVVDNTRGSLGMDPTKSVDSQVSRVSFASEDSNRDYVQDRQDSFAEMEEEADEDEEDSDSSISGLSKEVTLAVLPRLQMEELLVELRRRNVDVMAGSNNRKSLVKVLHRMMVGEYAVEELKNLTMVTRNLSSDKRRGSFSKSAYTGSESRNVKEAAPTKPIVWVVQPGASDKLREIVDQVTRDLEGSGSKDPEGSGSNNLEGSQSNALQGSQSNNVEGSRSKALQGSRSNDLEGSQSGDLEGSRSNTVNSSSTADTGGTPNPESLDRLIKQEPQDVDEQTEMQEESYNKEECTDHPQSSSHSDNMNWEDETMAEPFSDGESTVDGSAEQEASWDTGRGEARSGTALKDIPSSSGGGSTAGGRAEVLIAPQENPPKFVMTRAALKNPRLVLGIHATSKGKRTGTKRKCPYCSYKGDRNSLTAHVRIHTGEKPFKCSECDYSACQKVNLDRHMLKHTGEKPFMCGECGYRTAYKAHLMPHMLEHAGTKPYVCGECGYRSTRKGNLVWHQKKHQKTRPYKCKLCHYTAKRSTDILRHMGCRHKDQRAAQQFFCTTGTR